MHHVEENPVTGFHFRQDLEDSAVEVDLFRADPDGGSFLEVFGKRASDGQPDSVVVCVNWQEIVPLTGALMRVHRLGKEQAQRKAAEDDKRRGGKK